MVIYFLYQLLLKFTVIKLSVEKLGKMKKIRFTENSNIGIRNAVESSFPHFLNKRWQFFRRTSISDLEIACEPNFGWSVDALKR